MTTEQKNAYIAANGRRIGAELYSFTATAGGQLNIAIDYRLAAIKSLLWQSVTDATQNPGWSSPPLRVAECLREAIAIMGRYRADTAELRKHLTAIA